LKVKKIFVLFLLMIIVTPVVTKLIP